MGTTMKCGAHARSTGRPCQAQGMTNGRCKNHGGMSTGPTSIEGRRRIGEATKKRMLSGQLELAITGYRLWLDSGGRQTLSLQAKKRWRCLRALPYRHGLADESMG